MILTLTLLANMVVWKPLSESSQAHTPGPRLHSALSIHDGKLFEDRKHRGKRAMLLSPRPIHALKRRTSSPLRLG